MSSPPWCDVLTTGYCCFNTKKTGAIKLGAYKPGPDQGFRPTRNVFVLIQGNILKLMLLPRLLFYR